MLHKNKRFFGLLLAGLLLLPTIPAAAETTVTQGTFYVNETTPTPCNILGYDDYYGNGWFQYVPIANAFGYTTTYDGETQTVTSEKDGRIIRMPLNQANITITENGQTRNIYGFIREYEGSTYLASYTYDNLFDVYSYQGKSDNPELYLYTKEDVVQQIKDKLGGKFNPFSDYQLPESFTARLTLQLDGRADSDTFGMHFDGSLAADITISQKGEWTQLDATAKADGLANFIQLFRHPAVSERVESLVNTIDLEQPVNVSVRYNSDALYVKADNPYVLAELYDSLPWKTADEYKDSLPAQLQDKWICYQIDDSIRSTLDKLQNNLSFKIDMTQFTDSLANAFGKHNSVFRVIDAIATLSEQHTTITSEGGSTTIKADIPDGVVQQLLRDYYVSDAMEQSWLDVLKLSAGSETTINDKQTLTSSASFNIGLTNIPNPYGLQCGSANGVIAGTLTIAEGAEDIAAPEQTVSFQSIYDAAETVE